MFNVVLLEPEIPQNTGNIGRSVLAVDCSLHLIKPFAFSLDDKSLKRAGLDYWTDVDLTVWESFEEFIKSVPVDRCHFFSKRGSKRYDKVDYTSGDYLIFGKETNGIPLDILQKYNDQTAHIPMSNGRVRCINLASAASVVLFEALRQNNFSNLDSV